MEASVGYGVADAMTSNGSVLKRVSVITRPSLDPSHPIPDWTALSRRLVRRLQCL